MLSFNAVAVENLMLEAEQQWESQILFIDLIA